MGFPPTFLYPFFILGDVGVHTREAAVVVFVLALDAPPRDNAAKVTFLRTICQMCGANQRTTSILYASVPLFPGADRVPPND